MSKPLNPFLASPRFKAQVEAVREGRMTLADLRLTIAKALIEQGFDEETAMYLVVANTRELETH